MAMSLSHCAGSVLAKGRKTSQPALFTSTSIGPSLASAAATAASTLARSVMSQAERLGGAAAGSDGGGDLLGGVEIEVENGDARAFAGEPAAGRAADAAAAAGDDDGLVVETLHDASHLVAGFGSDLRRCRF